MLFFITIGTNVSLFFTLALRSVLLYTKYFQSRYQSQVKKNNGIDSQGHLKKERCPTAESFEAKQILRESFISFPTYR